MTINDPRPITPNEPVISERRLWFGLVAGPAAWAIHGFTSVMICAQACREGTGQWGPLPPSGVRLLLGLVTLVCLGLAVAGGVVALRSWRSLSNHQSLVHDEGYGRQHYMSLIGVFASAVFTLGVLWAGFPVMIVGVCATYH